MRMLSSVGAPLIVAFLVCSCGKDKATSSPPPQAYAVTLRYQSYWMYQCIRLNVGSISIDRCNLGDHASSQFGGDHEWHLYGIDSSQQPERYIPLQSGTVHLDRNMTCVVNYGNVTWY